MTVARWLLGAWFGVVGFAGMYAIIVTPRDLPNSPVRRIVIVGNTVACLVVLAGLIWSWPPGWYAALLIQVVSVAEGIWPDEKGEERPRWASRLMIGYMIFAVLVVAALCLPAARHAFGLGR